MVDTLMYPWGGLSANQTPHTQIVTQVQHRHAMDCQAGTQPPACDM